MPIEDFNEALKAELEYLRMENAYFKKLNALVQNKEKSPKQDKTKVVYELRNDFSVKALIAWQLFCVVRIITT
uniref:Transposase n=1 Tax=Anaerobacillus isosaccharinicus TaxID=1532552 RepID=A0A1S2KYG8_9BACI